MIQIVKNCFPTHLQGASSVAQETCLFLYVLGGSLFFLHTTALHTTHVQILKGCRTGAPTATVCVTVQGVCDS